MTRVLICVGLVVYCAVIARVMWRSLRAENARRDERLQPASPAAQEPATAEWLRGSTVLPEPQAKWHASA